MDTAVNRSKQLIITLMASGDPRRLRCNGRGILGKSEFKI